MSAAAARARSRPDLAFPTAEEAALGLVEAVVASLPLAVEERPLHPTTALALALAAALGRRTPDAEDIVTAAWWRTALLSTGLDVATADTGLPGAGTALRRALAEAEGQDFADGVDMDAVVRGLAEMGRRLVAAPKMGPPP